MFYVYSTLTADNAYAVYKEKDANKDIPEIERTILIKGGHGVANKHFQTPQGVVTSVSDEDMKVLEQNVHFKFHRENGFLKVERHKAETERVAADMEEKDKSAPLTPNDFKKENLPAEEQKKVGQSKSSKKKSKKG